DGARALLAPDRVGPLVGAGEGDVGLGRQPIDLLEHLALLGDLPLPDDVCDPLIEELVVREPPIVERDSIGRIDPENALRGFERLAIILAPDVSMRRGEKLLDLSRSSLLLARKLLSLLLIRHFPDLFAPRRREPSLLTLDLLEERLSPRASRVVRVLERDGHVDRCPRRPLREGEIPLGERLLGKLDVAPDLG